MNMMSAIGTRRCDVAVDALKAEFGGILADRILEAEALDFLWEARIQERYLGEQIDIGIDDSDIGQDVSRIAFLSILDRDWYTGICLVDGEGSAVELLWTRHCGGRAEAEFAFHQAR